MRPMTPADITQALDEALERAPELFLQYILANPGCRRNRPILMTLSAVNGIGDTRAEAAVEHILTWLLRRGDIYLTRGSLLWPAPPTLIMHADTSRLTAVGAVTAAQLRVALSGRDIDVESSPITTAIQGDTTVVAHVLSLVDNSDTDQDLQAVVYHLGMSVTDEPTLRRQLPPVSGATIPPSGHRDPAVFVGGQWVSYRAGRQLEDVTVPRPNDRLIHWLVDNDSGTMRRYFLRCGDGLVTELSWNEACLWEYAIDSLEATPGTMTVDRNHSIINLPHPLPHSYALWLAAHHGGPSFDSQFGYRVYPDSIDAICEVLAEKLDVTIEER